MRSDDVFLKHILEEANFLLAHAKPLSFAQFMGDEVLKRACARSLEIIGEAAKNLSPEFRRRHKTVEWKRVSGMRDKLVHQYLGVNWEILWDAIQEKLPELKRNADLMLRASRKS